MGSWSLEISLRATIQVVEIAQWYREISPELGDDFLRRLDELNQVIARNPKLYPPKHGRYRQAQMGRFPYYVFYYETSQVVRVVAVLHTARSIRKGLRGVS